MPEEQCLIQTLKKYKSHVDAKTWNGVLTNTHHVLYILQLLSLCTEADESVHILK